MIKELTSFGHVTPRCQFSRLKHRGYRSNPARNATAHEKTERRGGRARKVVEHADELMASAIKRLAEVFAIERHKLEAEWDKTDNVSTEDLRIALRAIPVLLRPALVV